MKILEKFKISKHVLHIVEHFEENDRVYWIMEYVPLSLKTYINPQGEKNRKILLMAEALQYFSQIITFIRDCHEDSYILK